MGTLVDTSVWVDFFRTGNKKLDRLLDEGDVFIHPYIVAEISCGNLKNRYEILTLLNDLPMSQEVTLLEVTDYIENNKLYGKGIGVIDFFLIISAKISNLDLWTMDKRLRRIFTQY